MQQGALQLIGNRGFRRYLRVERGAHRIDAKKVAAEARYDGKFVLRTNAPLPAAEIALQYKRLLLVEQFFRGVKSVLQARPIYYQWDATIRGHVFCSFLALVLVDELQRRLSARGWKLEWEVICQDLEALAQVEVRDGEQWYHLRTALPGGGGEGAPGSRGGHPAAGEAGMKCGAKDLSRPEFSFKIPLFRHLTVELRPNGFPGPQPAVATRR